MAEYLAFDGWIEFQPLRGKGSWIKDATDQQDKPKLSGLSFFAVGVLQQLRRVRGRTGKNIMYDIGHIARATHALPTDRPHLQHAIDTLIARGVLIVTNQEFDVLNRHEKEIENEKEIDKKTKPVCAEPSPAPVIEAVISLPLNSGKEFQVSEQDFRKWKELYPAVSVMQELRAMVGWLDANPTRRKTRNGVKAFINRWLAKAQNSPTAAAKFREQHVNGTEQFRTEGRGEDRDATPADIEYFKRKANAASKGSTPG